jgi:hypothetical protein
MRYAILTTEVAPKPDKKTGRMPTEGVLTKWQRVRPMMNEILQGKGLVKVAEDKVYVTGLRDRSRRGGRARSKLLSRVSRWAPTDAAPAVRKGHRRRPMRLGRLDHRERPVQ